MKASKAELKIGKQQQCLDTLGKEKEELAEKINEQEAKMMQEVEARQKMTDELLDTQVSLQSEQARRIDAEISRSSALERTMCLESQVDSVRKDLEMEKQTRLKAEEDKERNHADRTSTQRLALE